MPLKQMPNGEYLDFPDDVTPDEIARVTAKFQPSKRDQIAARAAARPRRLGDGTIELNPLKTDADNVADIEKKVTDLRGDDGMAGNIMDSFAHNASLGLDDVLSSGLDAATAGTMRAIKAGDIGQIGQTYKNNRMALKQYRNDLAAEHPYQNVIGSIAGLLANPIGAETGIAKAAGKGGELVAKYAPGLADAAKSGKAAFDATKTGAQVAKFGSMAAKAANSGIGLGARAGFNQGAITGLMDTGDVGDALHEGLVNGALGGVLSGVTGGALKMSNRFFNHSVEGAQATAYDKIAQLLARSENARTGKAYTPHGAAREIQATKAGGGQAVLGDLMPEGQGWMSYLAKQSLPEANHLVNQSKLRMDGGGERFASRLRALFGSQPSAYTNVKNIGEARKAAGKAMYTDDVMGRQLAWNDDLEKLRNNPYVRDVLPAAEKKMIADERDPSQIAFFQQETAHDPALMINTVTDKPVQRPSVGTLQYITHALNDKISQAVRSGANDDARVYSKINRQIKEAIGKEVPEFAAANATQRDMYEQAASTELGQTLLKHLQEGQTDKALDAIRGSDVHNDDLIVGFADAMMKLRHTNEDPVKAMRRFMRTPEQRAVLSELLGGNKQLNTFDRFLRREARGMRTDKLVTSGRQMAANLLKEPGANDAGEMFADIVKAGGQGMAFGGPVGAASRIASSVGKWDKTMSTSAKGELAKILNSDGKGVKKGIARSKAYQRILERKMRRMQVVAGKLPNAATQGLVGEGE